MFISAFPLYSLVYSNEHIYNVSTRNTYHVSVTWPAQNFMSKGFVYPFIYSIAHNRYSPPEGYEASAAAALFDGYEDEPVPDSRQVNIIAVQLEGFAIMDEKGFTGIDEKIYTPFREFEAESIRGNVLVNVYGGGTMNTEQSMLTGSYTMPSFKADYPSVVWYLRQNGYSAVGTHPYAETFYNRKSLMAYLGLDDFSFYESYYSAMMERLDECLHSDRYFFQKILSDYTDRADRGENVFSFNISMQGHSPYPHEVLIDGTSHWYGGSCPDPLAVSFSNYLAGQADTVNNLLWLKDELEKRSEPVVLLVYGDHMPDISVDGQSVYSQAGIDFDLSGKEGFMNYYSTPYCIWGNDAAKRVCNNDFKGSGSTVSIGFLMNVLFDELGWDGSAYMQLTDDIRESLSVATTNGQYIENGQFTLTPTQATLQLVKNWQFAQRYLADVFDNK